jgi:hypothetical protein
MLSTAVADNNYIILYLLFHNLADTFIGCDAQCIEIQVIHTQDGGKASCSRMPNDKPSTSGWELNPLTPTLPWGPKHEMQTFDHGDGQNQVSGRDRGAWNVPYLNESHNLQVCNKTNGENLWTHTRISI